MRAKLLRLNDDPRFTESRMEQLPANLTEDAMLALDPIRVKLLRERELPRVAKATMLTLSPTLTKARTDNEDPM
jgi:hypothetical protein